MAKHFQIGIKGLVRTKRGILLLQKRSGGDVFYDLPGGRIENVEDAVVALRREIAEELPSLLNYTVDDVVGVYRLQHDIETDCGLFLIVFRVEAADFEVVLSDEHFDYEWITSATLPKLCESGVTLHPELQSILEKQLKEC